MYSKPTFNASAGQLHKRSSIVSLAGTPNFSKIRRWDAIERTTTNWDCLRRDPELWFPDGDCLVHYYAQGSSRRGPSLRLSLSDIELSNCRPLLEAHLAFPVPDSPRSASSNSSEDGGFYSNPSTSQKHELFIPVPAHFSREESLDFHLGTRNFFAWMFEKPLVGPSLAAALISLQERMNLYRPDHDENEDDLLEFIDAQGYSDFRECPDHALAALQYAERFQLRDLWIDAFVHCVGMNNNLTSSTEFASVSRITKALITRAHLEMELRLEHADRSLCSFLEEELSGKYMGLPNEALLHLEHFRSFLQSFYVQRYGYWPPTKLNSRSNALSRVVLRKMYFDFRSLYDYLVDQSSTSSMQNSRIADGGICTLQNVTAFDRRYKYTSLPHPLPLLPDLTLNTIKRKPSGLARLFGSKQSKNDKRSVALGSLAAATNCAEPSVMESPLVREYFRFERESIVRESERLSCTEARKVRWILIYAVLQTLISVTRAPIEVNDTEGVSYPLCCQTAGTPPWKADPVQDGYASSMSDAQTTADSIVSDTSSHTEITPDMDCIPCEFIHASKKTLFLMTSTSYTALPMVPINPVEDAQSAMYTPSSRWPIPKNRGRRPSVASVHTTTSEQRPSSSGTIVPESSFILTPPPRHLDNQYQPPSAPAPSQSSALLVRPKTSSSAETSSQRAYIDSSAPPSPSFPPFVPSLRTSSPSTAPPPSRGVPQPRTKMPLTRAPPPVCLPAPSHIATTPRRAAAHSEIIIHGYGNGAKHSTFDINPHSQEHIVSLEPAPLFDQSHIPLHPSPSSGDSSLTADSSSAWSLPQDSDVSGTDNDDDDDNDNDSTSTWSKKSHKIKIHAPIPIKGIPKGLFLHKDAAASAPCLVAASSSSLTLQNLSLHKRLMSSGAESNNDGQSTYQCSISGGFRSGQEDEAYAQGYGSDAVRGRKGVSESPAPSLATIRQGARTLARKMSFESLRG
ncbi:hypothetical protein MMC25_004535 [Agyrium rufum]|nr:hypothetical protein [Agyrium rufum]